MSENIGKFFKISVHVYGVKKRCRKVERHMLSLGYIPWNEGHFNQEEVEAKARAAIAENMKSVNSAVSVALNCVTRSMDTGICIETWEIFGKNNREFKLTTSLEKELA